MYNISHRYRHLRPARSENTDIESTRAREVVITSASKPADPNEETLHWLRCIELGKTVYRPPFQVRKRVRVGG